MITARPLDTCKGSTESLRAARIWGFYLTTRHYRKGGEHFIAKTGRTEALRDALAPGICETSIEACSNDRCAAGVRRARCHRPVRVRGTPAELYTFSKILGKTKCGSD